MSSPADDLRAFTVKWDDAAVLDWMERNGDAVVALIDAAQEVERVNVPGFGPYVRGRALHALAAAVAQLTEPRP